VHLTEDHRRVSNLRLGLVNEHLIETHTPSPSPGHSGFSRLALISTLPGNHSGEAADPPGLADARLVILEPDQRVMVLATCGLRSRESGFALSRARRFSRQ
jgi:hypothetical protein